MAIKAMMPAINTTPRIIPAIMSCFLVILLNNFLNQLSIQCRVYQRLKYGIIIIKNKVMTSLCGCLLSFVCIKQGLKMITKEQILHALGHVEEPDLKKDLVTLNMIRNIEITPSKIRFDVVLTTPACPLKGHIERACRNGIALFVNKDIAVEINM